MQLSLRSTRPQLTCYARFKILLLMAILPEKPLKNLYTNVVLERLTDREFQLIPIKSLKNILENSISFALKISFMKLLPVDQISNKLIISFGFYFIYFLII